VITPETIDINDEHNFSSELNVLGALKGPKGRKGDADVERSLHNSQRASSIYGGFNIYLFLPLPTMSIDL
jgi:hypothetical protein